jgi:hypothetical protein
VERKELVGFVYAGPKLQQRRQIYHSDRNGYGVWQERALRLSGTPFLLSINLPALDS